MPLKNGELSTAEIRTLIRAHNKLASINIPAGAKRSDILKIIDDKGYKIDHVGKSLKPKPNTEKTVKKKFIPLTVAKTVTAPKKKSAEQVQKVEEKKKTKAEEKKISDKILKKAAVKEFKEKKKSASKAQKKKATPPVKKETPPVKKETPKKKIIKFTKKEEALRQKILADNKKEALEKSKPKRRVLKPTQKPTGSAVVQPGKPADLKIQSKKPKKFTILAIKQLGKTLVDQLQSDEMNNIMGKDKWTDDDLDFQIKEAVKNGGFLDRDEMDERFKPFYEGLTDEEKNEVNNRISDRVIEEGRKYWKQQRKKKKPQKSVEEKKKGNVERNKLAEIRKGINRIKDVGYLREIIDEWNATKKGKALEKTRGQPLRNTDNITKLKEKIMTYKMYDDVKIKFPAVVERKKMTAEEKAQKATAKKAKDALEKPILKIMLGWKQEFKDRKKDGQDEKELLNELEDRWDDLVEEHEEDAFDDDDFLDAMEKIKDTIEKNIKGKGKTAKEIAVDIADSKDFKEGFKKKKK